jgi:CRISPR-associated protein Cmr4
VYCPNQPVVRISCPALLKRYHKLRSKEPVPDFKPYSHYGQTSGVKKLFFNLGFLKLAEPDKNLANYTQDVSDADAYLRVVVQDTDIAMIHDMGLYRQSRVSLGTQEDPTLKVSKRGAFFNVEALPE